MKLIATPLTGFTEVGDTLHYLARDGRVWVWDTKKQRWKRFRKKR